MNLMILLYLIICLKVSNGNEILKESNNKNEEENQIYFVYKNYSIDNFCEYSYKVLTCNENNNISKSFSLLNHPKNKTYENVKLYLNFSNVLKKGTLFVGKEKNIEDLMFYDNSIKYIENEMFDIFTPLKRLGFYNTTLNEINENILTKKLGANLEYLYLKRNNISIIPTSTFKYMFNLITLNLDENQGIGEIINDGIFTKSLANLKKLSIENCSILVLNDNIFINVTNLTRLDLSHNPLTSIPKAINILTNLFAFIFGNTGIISIKHDKDVHNENIQVLHLSYSTKLIDIGDCAFCNYPKLGSLTLSWSPKLSIVHENAFGSKEDYPELVEIKMESCNISKIPEKLLERRVFIYIKDNPIIDNSTLLETPLIIF